MPAGAVHCIYRHNDFPMPRHDVLPVGSMGPRAVGCAGITPRGAKFLLACTVSCIKPTGWGTDSIVKHVCEHPNPGHFKITDNQFVPTARRRSYPLMRMHLARVYDELCVACGAGSCSGRTTVASAASAPTPLLSPLQTEGHHTAPLVTSASLTSALPFTPQVLPCGLARRAASL